MNKKITFNDLSGWLKAITVLGWVYTACVTYYIFIPIY
mgnify:CR=1 FL=1|jgi:hypothetical protein